MSRIHLFLSWSKELDVVWSVLKYASSAIYLALFVIKSNESVKRLKLPLTFIGRSACISAVIGLVGVADIVFSIKYLGFCPDCNCKSNPPGLII